VATNRAVSVTTSRLARLPDLEYTSRSRHSGTEMSCADNGLADPEDVTTELGIGLSEVTELVRRFRNRLIGLLFRIAADRERQSGVYSRLQVTLYARFATQTCPSRRLPRAADMGGKETFVRSCAVARFGIGLLD
jgi:hypothetical protein